MEGRKFQSFHPSVKNQISWNESKTRAQPQKPRILALWITAWLLSISGRDTLGVHRRRLDVTFSDHLIPAVLPG